MVKMKDLKQELPEMYSYKGYIILKRNSLFSITKDEQRHQRLNNPTLTEKEMLEELNKIDI